MEDIDGGLHPAVDGQSLDEGEGVGGNNATVKSLQLHQQFLNEDLPAGLVVKAPTSSATGPGLYSRLLRRDFSGSRHSTDLKKNGTPVGYPVIRLVF